MSVFYRGDRGCSFCTESNQKASPKIVYIVRGYSSEVRDTKCKQIPNNREKQNLNVKIQKIQTEMQQKYKQHFFVQRISMKKRKAKNKTTKNSGKLAT